MSARRSSDHAELIRTAINEHPNVEALIQLDTVSVAPGEVLVAAKVVFAETIRLSDLAAAINEVSAAIREAVPTASAIYLEPDVYTPTAPGTEAIVIRGAD